MSRSQYAQMPANLHSIHDSSIPVFPEYIASPLNFSGFIDSQSRSPGVTAEQYMCGSLWGRQTGESALATHGLGDIPNAVQPAQDFATHVNLGGWMHNSTYDSSSQAQLFPSQQPYFSSRGHHPNDSQGVPFKYNSAEGLNGMVSTGARDSVGHSLNGPTELHAPMSQCEPDGKEQQFDTPNCSNDRDTNNKRKYRVHKARRPARKDKARVAKSRSHSSRAPQSMPSAVVGQQNPQNTTIAVCLLWLSKNPGAMPSEHQVSCLSFAFEDSADAVHHWFLRNVNPFQMHEDSGYQTASLPESDIASNYRGNRRQCNREAGNVDVEDLDSTHIERDEARPYACTSRCGRNFEKKDAWKRHEQINRPPALWLCEFQACRAKPDKKRVYFRKDKFRKHLRRDHPDIPIADREDAVAKVVQIVANFSKYCIFRDCQKQFGEWNERINHIADHLKGPWHISQWRPVDSEIDGMEDTKSNDSNSDSSQSESSDDDVRSNHTDDDDKPGVEHAVPGYGSGAGSRGFQGHFSRPQRDQEPENRHDGGWTGYRMKCTDQRRSWSENTELMSAKIDGMSFGTVMCFKIDEAARGHLGSGSKLLVKKVKVPFEPGVVARKKTLAQSSNGKSDSYREVMVIAKTQHPHIVHVIGSYERGSLPDMSMRLFADCNLLQYMSAGSSAASLQEELWDWFDCMVSGLQHIHENGILHRDIKPSNILLKNKTLLFADFGLSNLIADDKPAVSGSPEITEQYAVPVPHQGKRGRAGDIFDLGCVFLEMATVLSHRALEEDLGQVEQARQHTAMSFVSPAHNFQWAIDWLAELGGRAAQSPSAANCNNMMRQSPDQRPIVMIIEQEILPRLCYLKDLQFMPERAKSSDIATLGQEVSHSRNERILARPLPDLVNGSNDGTLSDLGSLRSDIATLGQEVSHSRNEWILARPLPDLVNGSNDGTLSDLSSLSSISSATEDRKSLGKKLEATNTGVTAPGTSVNRLPLSSDAHALRYPEAMGMLQVYLKEDDPHKGFLVSGVSIHNEEGWRKPRIRNGRGEVEFGTVEEELAEMSLHMANRTVNIDSQALRKSEDWLLSQALL